MRIKRKLYIGIIFLFVEFLIVSCFSTFSTYKLSERIKMMTSHNVLSVQYAESMLRSVDSVNEDILLSVSNTDNVYHLKNIHRNIEHFEKDLQKQEGNITEAGEKELVGSLRENFNRYKLTLAPPKKNRMEIYSKTQRPLYNKIKSDLFNISHINMQAILVKNEQVSASVTNFYIWLSIIVTIFFLVSFSFIFNFPHYIAGPIEEFTASIKNFTRNNYQTRLHYELNDEFKELANAFNAMAERIEGYTTKKTKINLKKRKPVRSRKKKSR